MKDQCNGLYSMSLVGDGAKAVERAVNQGIDAHLEICNAEERGDHYEWTHDKYSVRLKCLVSGESLAVLLRRLTEMEFEEDDEAETLAGDILGTLGFDVETMCFEIVSRTDMETGTAEEVA